MLLQYPPSYHHRHHSVHYVEQNMWYTQVQNRVRAVAIASTGRLKLQDWTMTERFSVWNMLNDANPAPLKDQVYSLRIKSHPYQLSFNTINSDKIWPYSSSRPSKVIDLGANRKLMCNFLLVINSNFGRISYRFRDILYMISERERIIMNYPHGSLISVVTPLLFDACTDLSRPKRLVIIVCSFPHLLSQFMHVVLYFLCLCICISMFLFFYSLALLIYCLKCHACTFVTCFFQ